MTSFLNTYVRTGRPLSMTRSLRIRSPGIVHPLVLTRHATVDPPPLSHGGRAESGTFWLSNAMPQGVRGKAAGYSGASDGAQAAAGRAVQTIAALMFMGATNAWPGPPSS